MKIPFYEKFTLKTNKSASTIYSILKDNTTKRAFLNYLLKADLYFFEGNIENNYFNINRLYNTNYIRPMITGLIIEKEEFTLMEITMKFHILFIIFQTIWFFLVLSVLFICVIISDILYALICLIILILVGCIIFKRFNYETKIAKNKIIELIDGEILETEYEKEKK